MKRTLKNRRIPTPEETPSGFCGCGCGKPTSIAKITRRDRGQFRGYPMLFLHGHTHPRKGADSHKWKGGRWTHKSGYVYVHVPEHPKANRDGNVLEHRLVCEQTIGRPLLDTEHVHHINGIKDDNRPENLVALTRSEHMSLTMSAPDCPRPTKEQCSEAGKKGSASRWGKLSE